jgi:hypothetical protein
MKVVIDFEIDYSMMTNMALFRKSRSHEKLRRSGLVPRSCPFRNNMPFEAVSVEIYKIHIPYTQLFASLL